VEACSALFIDIGEDINDPLCELFYGAHMFQRLDCVCMYGMEMLFTCSGVISIARSEIVYATFVKISSDRSSSSKVKRILDVSFDSIDSIE